MATKKKAFINLPSRRIAGEFPSIEAAFMSVGFSQQEAARYYGRFDKDDIIIKPKHGYSMDTLAVLAGFSEGKKRKFESYAICKKGGLFIVYEVNFPCFVNKRENREPISLNPDFPDTIFIRLPQGYNHET